MGQSVASIFCNDQAICKFVRPHIREFDNLTVRQALEKLLVMSERESDIDAAYASFNEERQSAFLYRVLAQVETRANCKRLFAGLAEAADGQAHIWGKHLEEKGFSVPKIYQASWRVRLVAQLLRFIRPQSMTPVLAAMKVRGLSIYSYSSDSHDTLLAAGVPEPFHNVRHGGNLRAAVFGLSDGLVSNASLIMGMSGALASTSTVLLSGIAGLLAGAFSMAAGEWVSVRSQRELYEYQIALEKEELEKYPHEEARELALIYEAKGVPIEEAQLMADRLIADPVKALDTLAREELGLNPNDLGFPMQAALSSFLSFTGGAFIPLVPFILFFNSSAISPSKVLFASMTVSGFALFFVGAALSLFSGRSAVKGGLRFLGIGTCAGLATYFIGHLIGVNIS